MPKILFHNLTHPFQNASDPAIFNHDQQAIFAAEPGDIVVTRKAIESRYLEFISSLGYDFSGIKLLHSERELPGFNSVFSDGDLIREIRSAMTEKPYQLDVYAPTFYEYEFSRSIGAELAENPEDYHRWSTKSGFRKLAKFTGAPVPYGFEDISPDDRVIFLKTLARLFLKKKFRVAIKPDEGAAGMGAIILNPASAIKALFGYKNLIGQICRARLLPLRSSCFIMEEWLEDVAASPGIQLYIKDNGQPLILSVYQQILEKDGLTYRGCLSREFVPEEARELLVFYAQKIASHLAENGFRGYAALDAVFLKNKTLFFTDLNPRKVLSLYPQLIANKLGKSFSRDPYYASIRLRSRRVYGFAIGDLLSLLKPFLYSRQNSCGAIPYDYGRLKTGGVFRLMLLGENRAQIKTLFKEICSLVY